VFKRALILLQRCPSLPTKMISQESASAIRVGFRAKDGGLKNRCRCGRKSAIRQVLISRTLSVYGEVAERLKAAVC